MKVKKKEENDGYLSCGIDGMIIIEKLGSKV